MDCLINRDKLCKYIKTQINPYGKPFEGSVYEFGTKLIDHLLNMETVVDPVVHGYWVGTWGDGYADGYIVFEEWECSRCGYNITTDDPNAYGYCPGCGAKMDEED